MADQAIYAPMVVLDANGLPVAGARVFFYATGTNTLIDVFADKDGTILASNPVVADGAGYLPQRFFNGEARAVIQTPGGETIRTIDPVPRSTSQASAAANITFAPTLDIPQLDVQAAIEAVDANSRARDTAADAAKQPVNATLTSLAGISLVAGDILYATGPNTLARLEKGTPRQRLGMNAGATAPEWVTRGWDFTSAEQTLSDAITVAHGLGAIPTRFDVVLICKTADLGYSVGDIVPVIGFTDVPGISAITYSLDATNINVRATGIGFRFNNKSTNTAAGITNSSWRMILRASR